jgi:hypothetical protein
VNVLFELSHIWERISFSSSSRNHYGHPRRPNIRSLLDGCLIFTRSHTTLKLFWFKFYAHRALAEASSCDERSRFLDAGETAYLRLNSISFRIHVLHSCGQSMIHSNHRPNAVRVALLICSYEILQVVECKRYMLKSRCWLGRRS